MADVALLAQLDEITARLEQHEPAVRAAFQRIDEVTKLLGMKYRPEWAQPLRDDWQETLKAMRVIAALRKTDG